MHSLRSSKDIRAIRSAQRGVGAASMIIRARPRPDGKKETRVAVIAGRSIGNAVARNRVKRRLRAAARAAVLPMGADLVITARPAANSMPFASLIDEVQRLAARSLAGRRRSANPAHPGGRAMV